MTMMTKASAATNSELTTDVTDQTGETGATGEMDKKEEMDEGVWTSHDRQTRDDGRWVMYDDYLPTYDSI